ncbi:hypothetical protein DY000_02022877 [Brassica cretica]|uniref:Uncharacterized protein n=1 Tax=Brassica cretica TaxID=69181 RepID=A0ABQ7EKP1_BRACR|nr:hypothetical protein DY000_02022877 [Brassica cretica]
MKMKNLSGHHGLPKIICRILFVPSSPEHNADVNKPLAANVSSHKFYISSTVMKHFNRADE